jgi:hypothetical protein
MNLAELEELAKVIEAEILSGQEAWQKLSNLQAQRKAVAILMKRFALPTPAGTIPAGTRHPT